MISNLLRSNKVLIHIVTTYTIFQIYFTASLLALADKKKLALFMVTGMIIVFLMVLVSWKTKKAFLLYTAVSVIIVFQIGFSVSYSSDIRSRLPSEPEKSDVIFFYLFFCIFCVFCFYLVLHIISVVVYAVMASQHNIDEQEENIEMY